MHEVIAYNCSLNESVIRPLWHFLFFFAILRSLTVESKGGINFLGMNIDVEVPHFINMSKISWYFVNR